MGAFFLGFGITPCLARHSGGLRYPWTFIYGLIFVLGAMERRAFENFLDILAYN